MAVAGAEISSPKPALFTLCGLLAMATASAVERASTDGLCPTALTAE
jgi:hypothetical protein